MKSLLIISLLAITASAQTMAPYHQQADKIVAILKREGAKPDREAIALTLKAIDINLKKYFPKGPFTRHDWYAIAMAESRFDPKCKGPAGDTGIFQVLGSVADINRNTEDAFRVMLSKYRQFPDKRLAIIAYNGLIRRNGVVRDTYYIYVMKQKARIQNV